MFFIKPKYSVFLLLCLTLNVGCNENRKLIKTDKLDFKQSFTSNLKIGSKQLVDFKNGKLSLIGSPNILKSSYIPKKKLKRYKNNLLKSKYKYHNDKVIYENGVNSTIQKLKDSLNHKETLEGKLIPSIDMVMVIDWITGLAALIFIILQTPINITILIFLLLPILILLLVAILIANVKKIQAFDPLYLPVKNYYCGLFIAGSILLDIFTVLLIATSGVASFPLLGILALGITLSYIIFAVGAIEFIIQLFIANHRLREHKRDLELPTSK